MIGWWRDVIYEAEVEHDHTRVVQISHRYGMILFIASEVMFFVAWFWAYFNTALFPAELKDVARTACHRRRLAAEGHPDLRSLAPAALEHADPAHLRHHGHLGAPRAARERPQGPGLGADLHHRARADLHLRAGLRIRARGVPLFGQHLRRHLLHGDRISRRPRHHRHDLPDRLPVPRAWPANSSRTSISASSSPPGTGTSSTWCGCSCSPASMCGAPECPFLNSGRRIAVIRAFPAQAGIAGRSRIATAVASGSRLRGEHLQGDGNAS